jgi:predicted Zn-dependent protease
MLDKQTAKQIVDAAVAASKADEVFVAVEAEDTTHLRFARNEPSTSGSFRDVKVTVTSTLGRRRGSAETNQRDPGAIAAVVRRSEELARLAPEDPEHMPVLGPQSYPAVDAFDDGAVEAAPVELARGAAACLASARERGVVAAGFGVAEAEWRAIGSSRGLFGFRRATTGHFSQTVRTPDGTGSGWASDVGPRIGRIDFTRNAASAIDKALASRTPRPLAPGRYPVILEPACVADLVGLLIMNMDARLADEGRSFFSRPGGGNRLGEALFPDTVSILSDPVDRLVPGAPWGSDGVPQSRRAWIDRGKVASLAYDRFWAAKQGVEPVPRPSNTLMTGGSGSLAELIASTERAVLITSLWYIRGVDPRSMLHTGLTRDGVFMVENGAIAYPLTNFRWNDSPVAVLKNIEAMTAPVQVSPRSWRSASVAVPALRVSSFELSSVSDAV